MSKASTTQAQEPESEPSRVHIKLGTVVHICDPSVPTAFLKKDEKAETKESLETAMPASLAYQRASKRLCFKQGKRERLIPEVVF